MTPSKLTWVDPNDGWQYGFPKLYDPDKDGDMKEWLALEGYPLDQLLYTSTVAICEMVAYKKEPE